MRFAPPPPKETLFVGSSAGLEESAVRTRLPTGVSKSAKVKASAPEAVSSLRTWSARPVMVGGSLRLLTVTVNDVLLLATPSLAVNVIVAMPTWLVAGRTSTARLVPPPPTVRLALGISSVFPEEAVTVMPPAGISGSLTLKVSGPSVESSAMTCGGMVESVGASLVGLTVRVKVRLVRPKFVSTTEIVMAAMPARLVAGVMVTVRLAPLPPKTMLEFGTRFVSEDMPDRVSSAAGVTESPTVKGMAGVGVSSKVT